MKICNSDLHLNILLCIIHNQNRTVTGNGILRPQSIWQVSPAQLIKTLGPRSWQSKFTLQKLVSSINISWLRALEIDSAQVPVVL